MPTGLSPEIAMFRDSGDEDMYVKPADGQYRVTLHATLKVTFHATL